MEQKVGLDISRLSPKHGAVISIDGPAGTGKSSVTRRLADALGFIHVDTGALYRAIAFLTLEKKGLESEKGPDSVQVERELAVEFAKGTQLEFRRIPKRNPSNRIYANGRDITDYIRTPEVSMAASRISAVPEVRNALLGLQRQLGCAGKAILEGRDIGTVVFPDADIKFFLTATVEERAKRRLFELEASGADAPSFEELKGQIIERDLSDKTRAAAPLRKAADAVEIDTTLMTLDEVVNFMESIVRKRLDLK